MAGLEGDLAQLLLLLEQPGVFVAGQLVGKAVVGQDVLRFLQVRLAGEIGGRCHEITVALEEHAALDAGFHGRRDAKVDVELVAPQVHGRLSQRELDVDLGIELAKSGDQIGQYTQAEHHARMHAQQTLRRGADGGDVGLQLVDAPEDALELARVFLPRLRQRDLARGAQKQLDLQLLLDVRDHPRHPRRRDAETTCRLGKVPCLGDRQEQFHGA